MKKLLCVLLLCALLTAGCAAPEPEGLQVLTSFYPMYVFTLNLTAGVEGVTVKNMALPQTGCLHDYALTTADMKALAAADLFVVNGAGMEQFLEKALSERPELRVVDTSAGAALLEETAGHSHAHAGEAEGHSHGGVNSHIWMDPQNAAVQVENIAAALQAADPANAAAYEANKTAYLARIAEAAEETGALLADCAGEEVVAFHESFYYYTEYYGLETAAVLLTDDQHAPSAKEMAGAVDEVERHNIRALLADGRAMHSPAEAVAAETGAAVCALSAVLAPDGGEESTAYERMLVENARALRAAIVDRAA